MKQYDYIIVGSGLFGSIFAYEATQRGKRCLVIEKRNHVGGNIYCEKKDDINIHQYGAHIFHTQNKDIWSYMNRFSEFNNYINSPIANFNGEIFNLPFNMNTFNKMWGIITPQQAQKVINEQRKEIECDPHNLEEQAISLVGRDIYQKLIKGYTEKQWGRPCTELPAFIIKRIPVRYTYDNNYFNDRYQGIPINGYNVIIDKLLSGIDVHLDTNFLNAKDYWTALGNKVIYTGMIDAFFEFQYGKLEYRTLRFETQKFDTSDFQGVAVMNFTDSATPYTRIIEHKHFEFGSQPITYVTKEYPCEWSESQEPYYPINDEKNMHLLRRYQELALQQGTVIFGGRLAEYKYYDMDKTVESALLAVAKEFS
ncbi:UDP-galactopyranose mutase [Oscillospiraceae bacterium PP1C4]